MAKINPKAYSEIFDPHLNRRERLGYNAFYELNREREYLSTPIGSKPVNIKKREVFEYWQNIKEPIAFEYLLIYIRKMDDAFISHSLEQLKNG